MEKQPIIIKKIKKGGHGHHGGAWKVAYADFVTAMMAFFLLLWLLSATTKEQRSGMADYFTPTTGLKDAVGIGTKGGITATVEGQRRDNKSDPGIVVGAVPKGPVSDAPDKKSIIEATADSNLFENTMDKIRKAIDTDPELTQFKDNIEGKITPDGLKIDVSDSDKYALFEGGSATLTDFGKKLLTRMGEMIKALPNHVTITGHTDGGKVEKAEGHLNWKLSSERANAANDFLVNTLEAERVVKVIGSADRELLLPSTPTSPKNRRITFLLVRGSYLNGQDNNDSIREVLTVPKPINTNTDIIAPPAPKEEKPAEQKPAVAPTPAPAPKPEPSPASASTPAPAPAPAAAPKPTNAPIAAPITSIPGMGARSVDE